MGNDVLGWLVPLLVAGLVGAVTWLIKIAVDYTGIKKDLEQVQRDNARLEKDLEEFKVWDRDQHKELFESRNKDALTLERLTTLFEGMDKKIDEILDKERARNGVH